MPYSQVTLLPWLKLNDIQVGNVIFWKLDLNQIVDADTKDYLKNYSKCYIDKHSQPVETITVVSLKDKNNFEQLSPEEAEELNFARNILCFLCIAEQSRIALNMNNNSVGPPSSDLFDMVYQNFVPGTDDIAVKSGSVTSGGWTLSEIHFQEPWAVGGHFRSINRHVLEAVDKLLKSSNDTDLKNRLLRSTEWFRLAHNEGGVVTPFVKVVMMSTAFEIIFDIPNVRDKAGNFADKVEATIGGNKFKNEERVYGKNNEKSKTRSLVSWWAWDFYKLRNSVVHGDEISGVDLIYTSWITELIVADMVFYLYVVHLLSQGGYLDTKSTYIGMNFDNIYNLFKWK
jgi:hypothetical protein